MAKNFSVESHNDRPINIVLFVSRNKDNKEVADFKERRVTFITHEDMNSEKLIAKFNDFVNAGKVGELSRCYYSVNTRDPQKIHKQLLHFLIDNPDFNLCDMDSKIASIAAHVECAATKKWMFDFDIDDNLKVNEFMLDIHNIDPNLDITHYKTPHGYGVVVSHGFDTRTLYEKWDRSLTECKKDDLMCIAWKTKE